MIRYEFKDSDGKNWVRISKSEARKLYDRGEIICLCPCKLRPFTSRYYEFITEADRTEKKGFDELINSMEFYNCNSETGKYVSFYKMEV